MHDIQVLRVTEYDFPNKQFVCYVKMFLSVQVKWKFITNHNNPTHTLLFCYLLEYCPPFPINCPWSMRHALTLVLILKEVKLKQIQDHTPKSNASYVSSDVLAKTKWVFLQRSTLHVKQRRLKEIMTTWTLPATFIWSSSLLNLEW